MTAEARARFKMSQTHEMANLKTLTGKTVAVDAWSIVERITDDGEVRNVLCVEIEGVYFRTEVKAFVQKFRALVDSCGDEELPMISIIDRISKKGNPYITFEIV